MHAKHATRPLRRPRLRLIITAIGASTERASSSGAPMFWATLPARDAGTWTVR